MDNQRQEAKQSLDTIGSSSLSFLCLYTAERWQPPGLVTGMLLGQESMARMGQIWHGCNRARKKASMFLACEDGSIGEEGHLNQLYLGGDDPQCASIETHSV